MKLTKAQISAIVDEVNDQLSKKESNEHLSFKIKNDWEKLKPLLDKREEMVKAKDAIYEKWQEMDTAYDDYVEELETKVRSFEKKHGVDVDWRNEEEEAKFSIKVTDLSDKIERQITLMTIDTKEKITSDMLIEKMVEKFSQI